MAQALETLFNEVMKIERSAVLGAAPNQRTERDAATPMASSPRRS